MVWTLLEKSIWRTPNYRRKKIELQNLEKENLKAIIETYEKNKQRRKKLMDWSKIKSHDWVKIIEEGST